MKPKTILIAADCSSDCLRLVDVSATLAGLHPARIVLLHVLEEIRPIVTLASMGGGLWIPPPLPEAEREWREECATQAQDDLLSLAERIPGGCPVEIRIERGAPARTICAVAGEERADLVLLVSRGQGAMRRLIPGCATEVVNRAPCAVFVIRPTETSSPDLEAIGRPRRDAVDARRHPV